MKFRKKPIVVDAIQWTGANVDEVLAFTLTQASLRRGSDARNKLIIETLEGEMTANKGDWIIRGTKGEVYPCKPDIFAEIYEPLQEIIA